MTLRIALLGLTLIPFVLAFEQSPFVPVHRNFVVICDVSNSITHNNEKIKKNGNLEMVKRYALDISSHIRGHYSLFYLPVTDNMNEKPLPEGGIHKKSGNAAVMRNQEVENNNKIRKVLARLDELATARANSCILASIEHAWGILRERGLGRGSDSAVILIVSDMLESCEQSPLGGKYTLNVKDPRSVKKFKESYTPNISLAGLPVKIIILNSAPSISAPDLKTLTDVWSAIFNKMNYKSEILIRTTVPDSL